jgi:proline iminopeptidase
MPLSVGRTERLKNTTGNGLEGAIAEASFWRIGGVDQWVMIRGRSIANPLLLILHGGPGASETALFRSFNADLEEEFTVVYWDQRGAGRSYSRSIPAQSMTVDRFLADLDELINRLLARFAGRRVVLLGHSWGSMLGVLYASRFPAKIAAYAGVGQVADSAASEAASYAFALARAQERGQRQAVRRLLAIGPPPHTLEQVGVQRRWLMAMGGTFGPNLSLAKLMWRGLTSPEASPWDLVRMVQGSRFSLRLLWPELNAANLQRDVRRLEMPVFFLLGRLDMQVVSSVGAAYFEVLDAPHKALVWFETSGHGPPAEEPERFNRVMVETVRPFAVG